MRAVKVLAVTGLAALATTAVAESVSYDYDKAADFSRIKTYAWVAGTNLKDPINHKRVVDAIEAQLAAKGLTKVEAGSNPDALIAYHATFDKELRINGFSSGWGGYRFAGSRSGTAWTDTILKGTLVVDIVDAKSGSIIWRGVASKEFDSKASPEKRDKNVKKAADKLFKNYPPQGRG